MKKNIKFIILIVLICYTFIGNKFTKDKTKEHFKQFNSANIKGKIEKVEIAYKGVQFKLVEEKTKYVFYPRINISENKIFNYVAERGDSIVKYAYSDTLKLFKKDRILLFTFQKFKYENDK